MAERERGMMVGAEVAVVVAVAGCRRSRRVVERWAVVAASPAERRRSWVVVVRRLAKRLRCRAARVRSWEEERGEWK